MSNSGPASPVLRRPPSKQVLQGKLNKSWGDRVLRDHAEGGGAEGRPGIGELRVVQRVVEFRAEGQDAVFAKCADAERLAEREIGIELAGARHDALAGAAVSGGPVGSDGGRGTDGGGVDPAGE